MSIVEDNSFTNSIYSALLFFPLSPLPLLYLVLILLSLVGREKNSQNKTHLHSQLCLNTTYTYHPFAASMKESTITLSTPHLSNSFKSHRGSVGTVLRLQVRCKDSCFCRMLTPYTARHPRVVKVAKRPKLLRKTSMGYKGLDFHETRSFPKQDFPIL